MTTIVTTILTIIGILLAVVSTIHMVKYPPFTTETLFVLIVIIFFPMIISLIILPLQYCKIMITSYGITFSILSLGFLYYILTGGEVNVH